MRKYFIISALLVSFFFSIGYTAVPAVTGVTVSNILSDAVNGKWTAKVTYDLVTTDSAYVWANVSKDSGKSWIPYLSQSGNTKWQKTGTAKSINFSLLWAYGGTVENVSKKMIVRVYAQDSIVPDTMKVIPAGTFIMGHDSFPEAAPAHSVTVKSFKMDPTEVTYATFYKYMSYTPSLGFWGNFNRPVSGVSWFDIVLFCNARSKANGLDTCYQYTGAEFELTESEDSTCWNMAIVLLDTAKNGYRLPTEAEWEYAARAGVTTKFMSGDTILDTDTTKAWFYLNTLKDTAQTGNSHVVGKLQPNAFGLYDMIGNVYEYCNDWYEPFATPSTPAINPMGPESSTSGSRVTKGGSYWVGNQATTLALYHRRIDMTPERRIQDVGFRCVRKN